MPSERAKFKGVIHIGDSQLMNKLEINLKTWFDWAFLQVGGWTDVTAGSSPGGFGGDFSTLRLVDDKSFTAGTVWEAPRKDWTWETGVNYVDTTGATQNPTSPATVEVAGVPTVPDHINYPMGRIVFSTPIASTTLVQATYSYRYVQVYRADSVPWWQELQYRSFRPDDTHFAQLSSGTWAVGGQHRIQMPCIILEAVPRSVSRGFQLGDGAAWVEQDVLCHVIAESRNDRNDILDILRGQFDTGIWLFDNDSIAAASDYPLDAEGDIVDSAQTYPALVDESTGHRWESCRFSRTTTSEVEALNTRLYQGTARITCEVVLDD